MRRLGLEHEMIDATVYARTVERFRTAGVVLPTFGQLAEPATIPGPILEALATTDPDAAHPLNLFRGHWHNGPDRRSLVDVPVHLVLPPELTGIEARIVIALGDRFPMIGSHKVIAAYGCLAPRIVTGQFDPTTQRAVWPSTGNYCRGGVAISRIMGCHGVAVLPAGMSRERFAWLERWVVDPEDIIRTPGTESNVKEIYDRCALLDAEPDTVIFNQFSEFGNHIAHYAITGRALETIVERMRDGAPRTRLAAFVSASGSAGTLGAGDYLKERHGSLTVAVEALECPTMLANGFGEHNIQGIGDKHIPLIHDVMATDIVVGISDRATDRLEVLCSTPAGQAYLVERRGVPAELVEWLPALGFSSWCNVLAAIRTARRLDLGPDDVIVTVATDGASMYATEIERILARDFAGGFDTVAAAEVFGEFVLGGGIDQVAELTRADRDRIFNLGYYTWVEQQGVSIEEFEARRRPEWWAEMRSVLPTWDALIDELNARTRAGDVA
jgi:cysteine synthase